MKFESLLSGLVASILISACTPLQIPIVNGDASLPQRSANQESAELKIFYQLIDNMDDEFDLGILGELVEDKSPLAFTSYGNKAYVFEGLGRDFIYDVLPIESGKVHNKTLSFDAFKHGVTLTDLSKRLPLNGWRLERGYRQAWKSNTNDKEIFEVSNLDYYKGDLQLSVYTYIPIDTRFGTPIEPVENFVKGKRLIPKRQGITNFVHYVRIYKKF